MSEMNKRRVFLSGPMTGYEKFNFPKFDELEKVLRDDYGFNVVNPAHISRKFKKEEILKHEDAFRQMVTEQLDAEKECNTIFLLSGWEKSSGVRAELQFALEHGIDIMLESEFFKENGKRRDNDN